MIKFSLLTIIVLQAVSLSADKTVQTPGDVKSICVQSFGTAEGASMVREKIISGLLRSGRFTIVDATGEDVATQCKEADATLTGLAERIQGVFHLVGKSGQVFWSKTSVLSAKYVYKVVQPCRGSSRHWRSIRKAWDCGFDCPNS